jgi:hypothetical protein
VRKKIQWAGCPPPAKHQSAAGLLSPSLEWPSTRDPEAYAVELARPNKQQADRRGLTRRLQAASAISSFFFAPSDCAARLRAMRSANPKVIGAQTDVGKQAIIEVRNAPS